MKPLVVLLAAVMTWSASAWAGGRGVTEEEVTGRDRAALRGLAQVTVLVATIRNLGSLKLTRQELHGFVEAKLKQANVQVLPNGHGGEESGRTGILVVRVSGNANPMPLGGNVRTFTVTLQVLRTVDMPSTGQRLRAAIWMENESGVVGSLRPRPVRDALDHLLDDFLKDFRSANPASP